MLTNFELLDIANKMNIDCIDGCYYKDELILQKFNNIIPNREF